VLHSVSDNGLLKKVSNSLGTEKCFEGCGFLSAKGDNYAKPLSIGKEVFLLSAKRFFRRVKFLFNFKIDFHQFKKKIFSISTNQSIHLLHKKFCHANFN
jgi:hypothetical protein